MTTDSDGSAREVAKGQGVAPEADRFDVFLSYSRKDEEFGRRLEEALENYRLPKDVKTTAITKNRLNVFRDKKDLVPTDGDYYKTIEGYLKGSSYLVVICSPNARRSQYVNDEIKSFLRSHEPKRIIPVLLSGRPNNEGGASLEEYAFPEALCEALAMPLAVEFTEFESARCKVNKGRYRDSWYTLLAKIYGTERAEIERLDAKRQARRRAMLAAVSVAVIAALSVALVFALVARREAERQRQEAIRQRDQARRLLYASDVNLAQRAIDSGNVGLGRGLLESHLPAPQPEAEDLRGFEWYYLWRLYNGHLKAFEATSDIAFTRDGARFATHGTDAVKVWDAATMRETASLKLRPRDAAGRHWSEAYHASSIDFSPNGRTVAYGDDERVLLLDVNSGSTTELPPPGKGLGVGAPRVEGEEYEEDFWERVRGGIPRFSPDGSLLAVTYGCGLVAVYDARSLRQLNRLGDGPGASGCTSFVTFSPDGRLLAYGNMYTFRLWDVVARRDVGEPHMDVSQPDRVDQVESVAFTPDGKLLAIGDRSKQVVLWNVSTKRVLARLRGHEGWVSALAFSRDGKTLYSGGLDQTVRLWDFRSYKGDGRVSGEGIKAFATLKGHTGQINSIVCSPAGGLTATVGGDGTVKLWGDAAGREFDSVEDVEVISPGADLAVKTSDAGDEVTTTLIDLRGGGAGKPWTEGQVIDAAVTPDSKTLIAAASTVGYGDSVAAVKLWDAGSQREVTILRVQAFNNTAAFSRDGRLFMGIGHGGRSMVLWDTVAEKELQPVTSEAEIGSYLLSSDGKVLVTADKGGGRLRSWDVTSGKQSSAFDRRVTPTAGATASGDEERPLPMALSPDGKLLAFADAKAVRLWETGLAREPPALGKHEQDVTAVNYSPDGRWVAAGDAAGFVKIWDAAARREPATFKGHKDGVTTLAFSPDGRTLASGGDARDGAVKLYGMAAMRELLTLAHEPSQTSEVHAGQGVEDSVSVLSFAADGKSLAALSGNRVLRIWRGAFTPTLSDNN